MSKRKDPKGFFTTKEQEIFNSLTLEEQRIIAKLGFATYDTLHKDYGNFDDKINKLTKRVVALEKSIIKLKKTGGKTN